MMGNTEACGRERLSYSLAPSSTDILDAWPLLSSSSGCGRGPCTNNQHQTRAWPGCSAIGDEMEMRTIVKQFESLNAASSHAPLSWIET